MTGAAALLRQAHDAGIRLRLVDGERLKAAGPPEVVNQWAERLRAHREEIVFALRAGKAPNPDRFAWPHSSAWNVAELERFAARQARFLSLGLAARQAETLAAQLVQRDRGLDDRRACPECAHYRRSGRCANAIGAGTDIRRTVADIPQALAVLLQRCDGFSEAKYF